MSEELYQRLARISAATVSTQLLKRGLRSVAISGIEPIRPDQPSFAGPASTLRFLPFREDLCELSRLEDNVSSQRRIIEETPAGSVVVIDTGGDTSAGVLGDILATRLAVRGIAGLVTDGVVRDFKGVAASGLPVLCRGAAAPASIVAFSNGGCQLPVACGGVTVHPGDGIIADRDGAVVIPAALLREVVDDGETQEEYERWVLGEVTGGHVVRGLYPPDERTKERYEAWKASQQQQGNHI